MSGNLVSSSSSCSICNFVNDNQFGVLPTLTWLFSMFSKKENKSSVMLYMDDTLDEKKKTFNDFFLVGSHMNEKNSEKTHH